jgi:hypothetical protein
MFAILYTLGMVVADLLKSRASQILAVMPVFDQDP